jgi:Cyclin, N-terminal domain
VLVQTGTSIEIFETMAVYLKALKPRRDDAIRRGLLSNSNLSREAAFVATLLLACKVNEDAYLTFKAWMWNAVTGMSPRELSFAEKTVLGLLEYRLYPPEARHQSVKKPKSITALRTYFRDWLNRYPDFL